MGKLNLLKGAWNGKVGETVGAKWKNRATIRTYSVPSNPNTADQQRVRSGFGQLASFVSLFSDSIKYKTALNTAGMSVRNAILKANKEMINEGEITLKDVIVSKGGLQKPDGVSATKATEGGKVTITWNDPTATNFTENAEMVAIIVSEKQKMAEVISAKYDGDSITGNVNFSSADDIVVYAYFLDKRGGTKVASMSVGVAISA